MIVFAHTKFGLVWIQGSGVKGGGIRPRSERVFQIPVQIGLSNVKLFLWVKIFDWAQTETSNSSSTVSVVQWYWLLAVTGVMHEADDACSIRSTWSCYWLDQFLTLAFNILILSIFYISMDLSTNYFAHFSGCWASFVCSCHYPRMLCHVFWSQVEYKIVCFIFENGNISVGLWQIFRQFIVENPFFI